ncbi:MAG: RidA family protein [Cognatishimia sp.]|uniref:RidA family protein n=1 Tax=Cognatishimia sp. 1_MG-2023 TaxID=3062642 RepID=UPI0026E21434|nr:RidA family protein [Cognatishimia sp. 1_MG-2023]MDO6727692.1 RidA family protein [Cognatishimia sp. 1_MG-2023]
MKEIIDLPHLNAALAKLNTPTSLLVRSKDMLYSCGIPPMDLEKQEIVQGDLKEQTTAVLSIMKAALEGAGSKLEKVIKITIYVTDTAYFGPVNEVYKEFFPDNHPVRSFVAVAPWPLPFDVEIDCIAEA